MTRPVPFGGMATSQSLLRAVAVCATKSLLTHSIVSPTWAETCAGAKLSLSIVTRIVSAARAGAAHEIALNKLNARRSRTHRLFLVQRLGDMLGVLLMTLEYLETGGQKVLQLRITGVGDQDGL